MTLKLYPMAIGANITQFDDLGQRHTSYWSAPPKEIDHVGVGYLRDRGYKVDSQSELKSFKAEYKSMMSIACRERSGL